jgi:hypothetical protein
VVSSSKTSAWFVGLGLKTIGGRVYEFGPQSPNEGSEEEQTACGGIKEFALRQSYLMKGAVAIGSRLAWVGPYTSTHFLLGGSDIF